MGLQDLPDVHPARDAQRIEHDVDRSAVLQEGHVLLRHDFRYDALVAVPAGHLVAGLNFALYRHEDLDHLHDTGRQLVAALQFLDLVEETLLEPLLGFVVLFADGLELRHQLVVGRCELPPLGARVFLEHGARDLGILLEALRAGDALAAFQHFGQSPIDIAVEDGLLVVAVLGEPLDFLTLDRKRALVLLYTMTIEHPDLDHRPLHPGRDAQ